MASAAASSKHRESRLFGAAALAAAGVAMLIGAALDWVAIAPVGNQPIQTVNGTSYAAYYVLTSNERGLDLALGKLMALLGVSLLVLAVTALRGSLASTAASSLALIAVLLLAYQWHHVHGARFIIQAPAGFTAYPISASSAETPSIGIYVSAAGALVALAVGLLGRRVSTD